MDDDGENADSEDNEYESEYRFLKYEYLAKTLVKFLKISRWKTWLWLYWNQKIFGCKKMYV